MKDCNDWKPLMSGVSSELTTDIKLDYEAECERLMNVINILREENLALTQAVKGLSVALDMSKKLNN